MQFLIIIALILVILFGTSQCDGEESTENNNEEAPTTESIAPGATGSEEASWFDFAKSDTSSPPPTKRSPIKVAPNRDGISTKSLLSQAKPLDALEVGICANPAVQVATAIEKWDTETKYAFAEGYEEIDTTDKEGKVTSNTRIFAQSTSNPQPIEGDILSIARNQTFNQNFLRAKANIIRSLYIEISAQSYVKKKPSGLTMGTKIDKMSQGLLNKENELEGELEKLNEDIDLLSNAVVNAKEDELAGVTFGDRVDSLIEAATKKLDDTYNSQEASELERQRAEELSQRLNGMVEKREAVNESLEAMQEEINVFKDRIDSATEGELVSLYPLYGAKVVKQFGCYNDKTRKYANIIRVVWSTQLQEEAESAITGKTTESPGEFSARQHFAQLRTDMPTADRYVDDKGNPYFWTSRIAEFSGENLVGLDEFLEGQARIALALVLFSDMTARTKSREMLSNFDGLKKTVGIRDVELNLSSTVEDVRIRGQQVRSFFADDPYSNQQLRVSIAYVDMRAAARSLDLMAEIAASKKRILQDQAYIDSFRQAIIDDAESARDDPASAARGYRDGQNKMSQLENQRNAPNQNSAPESESKRKIENSGVFESDAVVDDF